MKRQSKFNDMDKTSGMHEVGQPTAEKVQSSERL